jgi:hypothetical protein
MYTAEAFSLRGKQTTRPFLVLPPFRKSVTLIILSSFKSVAGLEPSVLP